MGGFLLVALVVLVSGAGARAVSGDPMLAFLESLPPEPPGAVRAAPASISLPTAEFLIGRARELAPEGFASRPFVVVGAGIPREAVFRVPPEADEVRYLLPLLVVRNPGYPSRDALYYSVLGDLRSSQEERLPRSVVEIMVFELGSGRRTSGESVLVLTRDRDVALVWIGVRSEAWADESGVWRRAGRYDGTLVASPGGAGPDIGFRVTLMPHLQVLTATDRLTFRVPQPGLHGAELRVSYHSNFDGWRLRAEVKEEPVGEIEGSLPMGRLEYTSAYTQDHGETDWVPVPERGWALPPPEIGRRGEYRLGFRLRTTWQDPAGVYEGKLRLTVEHE